MNVARFTQLERCLATNSPKALWSPFRDNSIKCKSLCGFVCVKFIVRSDTSSANTGPLLDALCFQRAPLCPSAPVGHRLCQRGQAKPGVVPGGTTAQFTKAYGT